MYSAEEFSSGSGSKSSDWIWKLVTFAVLALALFHLMIFNSVVDDAYISFRYLDNWLAGLGLVYNAGERVEGYTNFLWIVFLAVPRVLGLQPVIAACVLSVGFLTLLVWSVYETTWALGKTRSSALITLAFAAASVPLARWTMSGMETVCFAALLAGANCLLATRQRHTQASSILFGLAALTRLDGVLFAGPAFLAAWLMSPDRPGNSLRKLVVPGLTFAAFPLAHFAFRLVYYGLPLPNTYYAKLGGDVPNLFVHGLAYCWRFLASGGVVLLLGCALLAWSLSMLRNWVIVVFLTQIVFQLAYVVWIGGDYFLFHRFLVPIVAPLAVLAGLGLGAALERIFSKAKWVVPLVTLAFLAVQEGLAWQSLDRASFQAVVRVREERQQVVSWLMNQLSPDALLAVNVAGVIPYRSKLKTIDMLGLNDRHIADAIVGTRIDGFVMVGHFKHDGEYVCGRAPDAVITSSGALHLGRSEGEAILQAALNTFPGDREFLRSPACQGRYRPVAKELAPGRYVVVYMRVADSVAQDSDQKNPGTAEEWFERGLNLMTNAKLVEAIEAFQQSLALNPGHPGTLTNLGFCFFDLSRFEAAIAVFEHVLTGSDGFYDALYGLAISHQRLGHRAEAVRLWRHYVAQAPESVWKEKARQRLKLLTSQ